MPSKMPDSTLNNLFPAIAESFVIILIGYVFGRFKLIDPSEARSLTTLVGKLALPALLFRNLAILDLSNVSWRFLGSILTAKLIVFVVVAIITFIVSRPWHIGRAGLYAIFATQSNDFALGLPIVQALYGEKPPPSGEFYYASYIYLVAPISLGILNPIGFFMLEYVKQSRRSQFTLKKIPQIVAKTFFFLCINPIIFMTVLGIIANVINSYAIHHSQGAPLPKWLDHFLVLLGGAYAPCALFNIGLFMVGKIKNVTGITLLVAAMLIFAKSVLMPLIGYVVIDSFLPETVMNTSDEKIASFGFLYCTFPTAPTVFIYASQYSVSVPIIATSIVFGTFFSAPLMYVSARMVLIKTATEDSYQHIISSTKHNVCYISMLCLAWVFLLFVLSRRYRSYLHVIVMHLIVAQFIECLGGLLLDVVSSNTYWIYFLFSLFFVGVFASRLWTAWLTVGIVLLTKKGPKVAEKVWLPMMFSSWGIPLIVTILLVVLSATVETRSTNIIDLSFLFGQAQLIISALFLLVAFVTGFICTIILALNLKQTSRHHHVHNDETSLLTLQQPKPSYGGTHVHESSTGSNDGPQQVLAKEEAKCSINTIKSLDNTPSTDKSDRDTSLTYFVVLVLFLLFSCVVGIMVVLWNLVHKEISGVFIAASVLDIVTNFGQGFFVFVAFGFEKYWFLIVLYQKVRRIFFKIENVVLPESNELSGDKINLCNMFKTQHMAKCKNDIVSDKKYHFQTYSSVFTGSDMVDWLIEHNIVPTREEAVYYGETLLEGRVISHVMEEHYFHDENFFYKFLN